MTAAILKKTNNLATELLIAYRKEISWILVFSFIANVLLLSPTLYMMQVYDRVLMSLNLTTLLLLSLTILMFFLLMMFADIVRSKMLIVIGNKIEISLSARLFESSLVRFLLDKTIDPSSYLRNLVELKQFIAGMAIVYFFDIIWTPIFVWIAFLLHQKLGFACLVIIFIQILLLIYNHFATATITKNNLETERQTQEFLNTSLRQLLPIFVMGFASSFKSRWLLLNNQSVNERRFVHQKIQNIQAVNKLYRYTVQTVSLGIGAYLATRGEITIGSMLAANVIISRSILPLDQMTNLWPQWIGFLKANQQLTQLFNSNTFVDSKPLNEITEPIKSVELVDVSYQYANQSKHVLQNVSLVLNAGDTVAILGKSGSGKTTLVKALLGVLPTEPGQVLYNNQLIDTINLNLLSQSIGYLPQDFQLFEGTIAENIARFGALDSEAITSAAIFSGIHEWVLRLPKGYDTLIGNNGQALSGGQKQQLGIARAVYGQSKLIVLDEPNSNLDDSGERSFFKLLDELKRRQAITIIISHRENILQFVNKVVYVNNGHIVISETKKPVMPSLKIDN